MNATQSETRRRLARFLDSEQVPTDPGEIAVWENIIREQGGEALRQIKTTSASPPALFLLSLLIDPALSELPIRQEAFKLIPDVIATADQLFQFVALARLRRGWGRGLKLAIANWYNALPVATLTVEVLRTPAAHGWTHRDLLAESHPKPIDEQHRLLYAWLTGRNPDFRRNDLPILWAWLELQNVQTEEQARRIIERAPGYPSDLIPDRWRSRQGALARQAVPSEAYSY